MNRRLSSICTPLISLALVGMLPSSLAAIELWEQTANAIQKLSSYDVVADVERLHYSNGQEAGQQNPSRVNKAERVRDVFAMGLGRRVERNTEKPDHTISIKEWGAGGKSPALELSYSIPGLNYFDYFNPNCDGLFLSELLNSHESKFKLTDSIQVGDVELPGFEFSNPKLRGFMRIWVDRQHGNMPARIQVYRGENDSAVVLRRTEISKYIELANGTWAPTHGELIRFKQGASEDSKQATGFALRVDEEGSSWNSVESKEPFTIASLPKHNWTQTGWNQYQPEGYLEALKAQQAIRNTIAQQDGSSRVLWIVLNLLAIAMIILVLVWKRTRPGLGMTSQNPGPEKGSGLVD